jgi:hypothetical protein
MIRDDIVERLRDINISWSDSGELAAAAADEIERLREELKTEHALSFRDQVFMLEERLAEFTAERNRAWGQAHWTEYERSIARAEREACAAVLERGVDLSGLTGEPVMQKFAIDLLVNCAAAIRARGGNEI